MFGILYYKFKISMVNTDVFKYIVFLYNFGFGAIILTAINFELLHLLLFLCKLWPSKFLYSLCIFWLKKCCLYKMQFVFVLY